MQMRQRREPIPLLLLLLLCTLTPSVAVGSEDRAKDTTQAEGDLMQGKTRTPRAVEFVLVVDGSPEEVFDHWVNHEDVSYWFGTGANMEPRVGGLYEIHFGLRPDGEVAGPRGNRILRLEPGRALDFEWDMPQFAKELNTQPLPTWVEVRFESFSDEPPKTQIHFAHQGFGEGESWDRCYEFFERGWFEILFRLKLHCSYFSR